jgi:hypothetical protein
VLLEEGKEPPPVDKMFLKVYDFEDRLWHRSL